MNLACKALLCVAVASGALHDTDRSIAFENSPIPQIDLRWPERDIVEAIHSASAGPGFFYLLGHGIPEAVFKETIQASHSFFEQPTQLKQQISALNYGGQSARGDVMTKGYTRPGSEGAYKKDTATDVRPEKEAATLQTNGRETLVYRFPEVDDAIRDKSYWRNDSEVGRAARKFFMKNQWPGAERLPQFRSAVQEFFDHSARVAGRVIKYIDAAAHPLDANGHAIKHDLGMHTFNFAHYHPNSQYAFGISDHTDWEYFTLLYPSYLTNNSNIDQETGISFTGLEVFFHEEWISVPHVPGSLIVNLGEMLSRFTKGKFKTPVHRVQGNNAHERYSLISFWAPNYDTMLPDPEHGAIPAGEYYLERNKFL